MTQLATTIDPAPASAVDPDLARRQGMAEAAWRSLPPLTLDAEALRRHRIMTRIPAAEAAAFDGLRTRTLRHMQSQGWRRLAITSPTAGCGKSTLTLNLALSLARQKKLRAIVLEMDMRAPGLNRLLGRRVPPGAPGAVPEVARLLGGAVGFEAVAGCVDGNLALVTNTVGLETAADLLLDSGIGAVLDEIEARFQPDLMLFDMPPALPHDDTPAFLRHVDCALIVAAAETSTVAEIDRCERLLADQTNVMGVVLNKCRM